MCVCYQKLQYNLKSDCWFWNESEMALSITTEKTKAPLWCLYADTVQTQVQTLGRRNPSTPGIDPNIGEGLRKHLLHDCLC